MRRNRGSIFIFALGVMVVLIGVLASTVATQRAFAQQVTQESELIEARIAAYAGIERARQTLQEVADLTSDSGTGTTGQTSTATTLNDTWYTLGNNGDENFVLGGSTFRIQVLDACGLIDINSATEAQLQKLPLAQDQIESLLDFREGSLDPRALGAKDTYYNNLETPYNTKLARFDTFDELLHVKGFTAKLLYEPSENTSGSDLVPGRNGELPVLYDLLTANAYSPNTRPDGTARVNINAQGTTAQTLQQPPISIPVNIAIQIAARKNWGGIGEVLALPGAQTDDVQRSVLDYLTTNGATRLTGKINLNTASESVLSSVPDLTPDMVQAILQRQSQTFTTLSELTSIPGMTGQALQSAANVFTVQSQTFLVRVIGRHGSQRYGVEAIIEIRNNIPTVVAIQSPPFTDMRSRWYWQDETTTEVVLKEAQ